MAPRADYGSSRAVASSGGIVASVEPASPAARGGVLPGDTLLSVDGAPLRDVLDWQWHTSGAVTITVSLVSPGDDEPRDLAIHRAGIEGWGIAFEAALFDGVRRCRNDCAFCFMSQLPKGLRPALYLRDDDYRLSFLQGNFVTLTNLRDADVDRIAEQALSPLYVSVHAVTPPVRAQLVGAREDRALERIDELLAAGVAIHAQIVLVPDVNDGDELEATLTWLAEREGVASVGIVPLGWTAHQQTWVRSFESPEASRTVIEQVSAWQQAFRERDQLTWVYLADEFYLNAGEPLPPGAEYDGFPQFENGIGIARSFLDDAAVLASELAAAAGALIRPVVVVTGTLAAGVIAEALAQACAPDVGVLPVPNAFFGGNVAVTGLLAADDIIEALRTAPPEPVYLIPDTVFNADGLTLDDVAFPEIAERSGRDVRLVSSDAAGLLDGLRGASGRPQSSEGPSAWHSPS